MYQGIISSTYTLTSYFTRNLFSERSAETGKNPIAWCAAVCTIRFGTYIEIFDNLLLISENRVHHFESDYLYNKTIAKNDCLHEIEEPITHKPQIT